jgi:hypothetical protein
VRFSVEERSTIQRKKIDRNPNPKDKGVGEPTSPPSGTGKKTFGPPPLDVVVAQELPYDLSPLVSAWPLQH